MSGMMGQVSRTLGGLLRERSGVAMIEFAFTLPIFLALLGGGLELTKFAITHMRLAQVAASLADNASRAKQGVVSGVPRIREADVNEVFTAAELQAGGLKIRERGKVILSSVEANAEGGQWIHWQRCFGAADYRSSYGREGDGETGTSLTGIGPAGRQVAAEQGSAIMFVELVYDYEPMMFGDILDGARIRKTAAMYVRDNRDLLAIYNPAPSAKPSRCE